MATIKIYLDVRTVRKDGMSPLKIYISHKGKVALIGLNMYVARHSWATVAYSLDVPKETISEALGHEIGSRVTSIYIAFDRRKVDMANRNVINALQG